MLDRSEYPAGVPCWVDTAQPDPEAAMAFYGELFGWQFEERSAPEAPERYFVAQLGGRDVAGVGSQPEGAPPTTTWSTYVAVGSADGTAAAVEAAGGAVLAGPFDVDDAGRMGVFADPAGAVFCGWEAKRMAGAEAVNEPGTWNFSELNTRDTAGAKAFYGKVFGWEVSGFGDDSGDFGFWRSPGYGDFLDQLEPGTAQGMKDMGAPEGFEDAVAWLVPMSLGALPEGTPPHWHTTFAVDDADAVADHAARLGGEVIAPPMDAPWVRMTVLRDPQGAAFTASKFMPPT